MNLDIMRLFTRKCQKFYSNVWTQLLTPEEPDQPCPLTMRDAPSAHISGQVEAAGLQEE